MNSWVKRGHRLEKYLLATHLRGLVSGINKELKNWSIRKQPHPSPRKWNNERNRRFGKEEIQIINKYMKNCRTSLVIGEVPTKITLIYIALVWMSVIKEATQLARCGLEGKNSLPSSLTNWAWSLKPTWQERTDSHKLFPICTHMICWYTHAIDGWMDNFNKNLRGKQQ